mmetsp:Transcript_30793/g.87089  ORF Transcript_30793/g.87089 Transcript_30793/m.87089 type:complete len:236 (+) Transcript_30793:998-1705(+)
MRNTMTWRSALRSAPAIASSWSTRRTANATAGVLTRGNGSRLETTPPLQETWIAAAGLRTTPQRMKSGMLANSKYTLGTRTSLGMAGIGSTRSMIFSSACRTATTWMSSTTEGRATAATCGRTRTGSCSRRTRMASQRTGRTALTFEDQPVWYIVVINPIDRDAMTHPTVKLWAFRYLRRTMKRTANIVHTGTFPQLAYSCGRPASRACNECINGPRLLPVDFTIASEGTWRTSA